jgi:peptide deformylase
VAEVEGEIVEEERDPEQEARRRLALAQIRQYPDPALRLRAHEVEEFDDNLRRLADRMVNLMHDARGVGLAGTQVGTLQRLFVFQPREEDEARTVVNPEIVEHSDETASDVEGCLSLQGVLVQVDRSVSLTLVGQDEHGKPLRLELSDHAARVVQHELDHLDGVLIIDRTDREHRKEALALLRPRVTLA